MSARKKQTYTGVSNIYNDPPEKIDRVFYGLVLDEHQQNYVNSMWDKDKDIVFCNACSGSGKTTLAVGVADLLIKYGFYKNIVYIMSPYAERVQGWLPGDISDKSSVYFEPLYQAMVACNINPYTAISNTESQKNGMGYITCITDTYLRGQNLNNAVVIIDEAQNYTTAQLKKVLTRIGDNAKVIVIGHDKQCDLEDSKKSGFVKYINHFEGTDRAAFCELKVNHRSWISQKADELEE